MVVKNKMGRPRKDTVDKYRVQTWFKFVSGNSERTAYQLEKEFSPEKFKTDLNGNISHPCIWGKYRAGKVTPGAALLEKVDKKYPGSLFWLNHPIWILLADRTPSREMLKASVAPAKSRLTKIVGEYNPRMRTNILTDENTYNYFYKFDLIKKFGGFSERDSIDKLIGALALLIDAEIRGCHLQYEFSYRAVLCNLSTASGYLPYIDKRNLQERVLSRFPFEIKGNLRL
ncbi:MAG: hypothetical protein JKX82_12760 [Oleispira sp.]|nr:hypothetical protein [Oleispira sp.]